MLTRRILFATAATAVLFGSLALTAPANAEPAIITLAYTTTFPDIDPSTSFSNDSAVTSNVYETLVKYQVGADGVGKLVPSLAEKWESSADGKQWTFHLRQGVTFHDGAPLDAAAVKASIERTKKLNGGAAWIWSGVNKIEVKDPATVVMDLDFPQPLDLIASSGYAAWILSPKALDKDGAWFNAGHDAGTGPYTIDKYEPGQRAVLKKFDAYWGGWKPGQFDYAVMNVVEDPTLRQQQIESGEADWTYEIPIENLGALKQNPDLNVVVNPTYQNLFGMLNTKKKPLDDAKVRQAVSYAFPYDDVVKSVMDGYATKSFGTIPKGLPGFDASAKQYNLDLDKAKALLSEAGVKPGTTISMTYATGDTAEEQVGELWKANLAKIGITLDLQPMAWEAQWGLAKSDPAKAQDIFVMNWWPTYVTAYDFLFNLYHSEKSPNFNLGYYSNSKYDALIDKGNETSATDPAAANKMFQDAQKMLIDDAAGVFFYDQENMHVIRSNIKGYIDNPAYSHVVFVYDLTR